MARNNVKPSPLDRRSSMAASVGFHRSTVLSVFLFLLAAGPLEGQSILGRILVAGNTLGVDGVSVTVLDQGGSPLFQVQSDSTGLFRISLEAPGSYGLSLTRLGFRSFQVEVEVGDREMVEVELRMAEEAIPLDPLVVTARREIRLGTLDEFYDRMERNKRRGVGQFITREEVDATPVASTAHLLARVPGVYMQPAGNTGWAIRMRERGDYCTPTYYLDGLETSWDRLPHMEDIEGVEIYRTRFEQVDGYWPSTCGIVFMWRRPDWGNPFSWGRLILAGGFVSVALVFALIL
jgi:hypothetical protein